MEHDIKELESIFQGEWEYESDGIIYKVEKDSPTIFNIYEKLENGWLFCRSTRARSAIGALKNLLRSVNNY